MADSRNASSATFGVVDAIAAVFIRHGLDPQRTPHENAQLLLDALTFDALVVVRADGIEHGARLERLAFTTDHYRVVPAGCRHGVTAMDKTSGAMRCTQCGVVASDG